MEEPFFSFKAVSWDRNMLGKIQNPQESVAGNWKEKEPVESSQGPVIEALDSHFDSRESMEYGRYFLHRRTCLHSCLL